MNSGNKVYHMKISHSPSQYLLWGLHVSDHLYGWTPIYKCVYTYTIRNKSTSYIDVLVE